MVQHGLGSSQQKSQWERAALLVPPARFATSASFPLFLPAPGTRGAEGPDAALLALQSRSPRQCGVRRELQRLRCAGAWLSGGWVKEKASCL